MNKEIGWVLGLSAAIMMIAILTFPTEKNRLEYIEERMDSLEREKSVLTQKEKELEAIATEKEWQEVDNDNNK